MCSALAAEHEQRADSKLDSAACDVLLGCVSVDGHRRHSSSEGSEPRRTEHERSVGGTTDEYRTARSDEESPVRGAELGDAEWPREFEPDNATHSLRPDQAEQPGDDRHGGAEDGWEVHVDGNTRCAALIPGMRGSTQLVDIG